jgi:NAD(P)-dependent dehydrogenase (short-subunit alcohol dehydrogenase family)
VTLQDFSLEGRVALVTGASKGLGAEIARVMAEAGADVVASARDMAGLQATAAAVAERGRKCHVVRADVTSEEDLRRMVDEANGAFGRIDILVNNAGYDPVGSIVDFPGVPVSSPRPELTLEAWESVFRTNLTSAFLTAKLVGPQMLERRSGKVINIGSVEGNSGRMIGDSAYASTKAALSHFTRLLALEWAPFQVNVNCLAPGLFWTDVWQSAYPAADGKEQAQAKHRPNIPMGHWGDLRDVGTLAVFLASDASKYITGQTIYVDGGFTAA